MTNKSMSWKELNKPILLHPVGKDYLWGGSRLREEYGKNLPEDPLAETWECSTHPDGVSIVASGEYQGMPLDEVLKIHPEWLGSRLNRTEHRQNETDSCATNIDVQTQDLGMLPVLIKFIDAAKDLSVQVHPGDAYARVHENQAGKTEMWYVLEAEPGAKLIYGFNHDITREQLLESLQSGKVLKHLQQIPVHKNDVFFIQPGTVHAIGKGVVVAEIQECSNVTYRLYDYDRIDKNGEKRPLHVGKALDVLNLNRTAKVRQQMRLMRYRPGSASEILCRCRYFQVDRVLISEKYRCRVENTSFQVLLVLEGNLQIESFGDAHAIPQSDVLSVTKGDCVFLPADCGDVEIRGRGQLLQVFC